MLNKIRAKIIFLLRQSEKWTHTDMVYLAKGGFWLTFSQAILSAAAFILSLAFANFISQETYGVYKYVLSTVGLLSIFALSGMYNSVLKAVAQGFEGSIWPAVRSKLRWGSLGGIAVIGVAAYYYWQGNVVLAACFALAGVLMPLMEGFSLFDALLNGKKLFALSAKYNIAIQLFSIFSIILTLWLSKNVILIILVYYLSFGLGRLAATYLANRHAANNKIDKGTLPYGKHLTLMNILGAVSSNIDKVMLWHFLGPASVAVYSFALAPVNQISAIMKPVTLLAFPKFAENNPEEIKKTLPLKMAKFSVIVILGVIIYYFLCPHFYKIFFPQYIESIRYSLFYSLTLLFFPQKLIGTVLQAKTKTKELYLFSVTSSIVRISAYVILLPLFGIYGAIGANLACYVYGLFLQLYFLKKL